jgi:hypothetical protein
MHFVLVSATDPLRGVAAPLRPPNIRTLFPDLAIFAMTYFPNLWEWDTISAIRFPIPMPLQDHERLRGAVTRTPDFVTTRMALSCLALVRMMMPPENDDRPSRYARLSV